MSDKTCATCRWWDSDPHYFVWSNGKPSHGSCGYVKQGLGSDERPWTRAMIEVDGWEWEDASLITDADFFCAAWEERDARVPEGE